MSRLNLLQAFPFCVIDSTKAEHDLSKWLKLTKEQLEEFYFRVRTFRFDFDLTLSNLEEPIEHFVFSTTPDINHYYAPNEETQTLVPESEKDFALFNQVGSNYACETYTPLQTVTVRLASIGLGKVTADVFTVFFAAGVAYKDEDGFYYVDFVVSLRLVREADNPPEDEEVTATLNWYPKRDNPPELTGDVYGNPLGGNGSIEPEGANITITGTVSFVPVTFWPYAKEDGTGALWDASTGAPIPQDEES